MRSETDKETHFSMCARAQLVDLFYLAVATVDMKSVLSQAELHFDFRTNATTTLVFTSILIIILFLYYLQHNPGKGCEVRQKGALLIKLGGMLESLKARSHCTCFMVMKQDETGQ